MSNRTTRWIDNSLTNINEAICKLLDEVPNDEKSSNMIWENWSISKQFTENKSVMLNGKKIEYNYIKFSFDSKTLTNTSEERTVNREGFIIVYSNGSTINYIIDQNSSAQKILRKLLSYTKNSQIEKNSFELTNKFFIWLIYRVYMSTNDLETVINDKKCCLDAIKGFKGNTEDLQTKVSASGETVMNIISTLAFILESSKLHQVNLDLQYTNHSNISLVLARDTVYVITDNYSGAFEREEDDESKIALLYLTIYLEILPLLDQEYNSDISNGLWNDEVYAKFMQDVGSTITDKIKSKINALGINE